MYTPQTWTNGSQGGTFFINGPHLNHIEEGISDVDTRLATLETEFAEGSASYKQVLLSSYIGI